MKIVLTLAFLLMSGVLKAIPESGFYLPDSMPQTTFRYTSTDNLVILHAVINDTIHANLILDTGCRNILLFGKKFSKMISKPGDRKIDINGLGNGKMINGYVSMYNQLQIENVKGKDMTIVVIPERNVFEHFEEIDGIVGYELFTRFEVTIDFPGKLISFRTEPDDMLIENSHRIPMLITDTKPIIQTIIQVNDKQSITTNLLIDTGSTLSLLISTKKENRFARLEEKVMGKGINGLVMGAETLIQKISLRHRNFYNLNTAVIFSRHHEYASVGTGFLKDYVLTLNYNQGYFILQPAAPTLASR